MARGRRSAGAAVLISAEPIYRHVLHKAPDGNWADGRRRYLKRLAGLLAPFEVEPVLVFRRPEDFARSSFQERVMKSSSAPWGSFAEFRDQAVDIRKYFRNAKMLQAVFGNLTVMTFEDLMETGSVTRGFFGALGVDVSDLDDGGVVRESLGPRETAVKLALIRRGYPPERNAAVLDWLRAPDTTERIDENLRPRPLRRLGKPGRAGRLPRAHGTGNRTAARGLLPRPPGAVSRRGLRTRFRPRPGSSRRS